MRTPDQVQRELLEELLPPGWAFRRDPGSVVGQFLYPLADMASAFEQRAEQLVIESDIRAAVDLLPDYERVLGPDPCVAAPLPFGLRRLVAWQRWTGLGGASIAYFTGLAAGLGVPIAIEEFPRLAVIGRFRVGQRLRGSPNQFFWRVRLAPTQVTKFHTGVSRMGDRLGAFSASFLECVIRRNAPAHTVPLFAYDLAIA